MAGEKEHSITRREFLKTTLLGMSGSVLCGIGVGDGSEILVKRHQYLEAERDIKQGLTKSDQLSLKTAQKKFDELEKRFVFRNLDEADKYGDARDQLDKYNKYKKAVGLNEKYAEPPSDLRVRADFAAILTGLIMLFWEKIGKIL